MAHNPKVIKIAEAHKEAWPEVSAAITRTHHTMLELAGIAEQAIPAVEDYVAKGPTGTLRRRKVCEETVWVLASLGWLRTGGERDVVLAAKDVVDSFNDASKTNDECIAAEDRLVDAVDSLPEYMIDTPTPQEA